MRTTLLSLLSIIVLAGVTPAEVSATTAYTMDAKLCPDGVTYVGRDGNRNCEWQLCPGEKNECMPYLCNDGTTIDRCTPEGKTITYIAMPCLTHGGDIGTSAPFSDVPVTHANAEAIAYMKALGMIQGYTDGTFKPEATINRAEFTAMITGRQFNSRETVDSCIDRTLSPSARTVFFRDVKRSDWFAKHVCMAKERHIVDGYPDGTFKPGATITFVESAKILTTLFIGNVGSDTVWYARYVGTMADAHAIPLSITRLDQPITRGELAEIIWRMKTANINKPSRTFGELEMNTRLQKKESFYTYHHSNPAFSLKFPAGWSFTDDRGDMDIYFQIPDSTAQITFTYCDNENCNGPLNDCGSDKRETVPTLGVKGCLFTYENGREVWSKIGVPINGTYFFTVEGTKEKLRALWPIIAKMRASLRME